MDLACASRMRGDWELGTWDFGKLENAFDGILHSFVALRQLSQHRIDMSTMFCTLKRCNHPLDQWEHNRRMQHSCKRPTILQ